MKLPDLEDYERYIEECRQTLDFDALGIVSASAHFRAVLNLVKFSALEGLDCSLFLTAVRQLARFFCEGRYLDASLLAPMNSIVIWLDSYTNPLAGPAQEAQSGIIALYEAALARDGRKIAETLLNCLNTASSLQALQEGHEVGLELLPSIYDPKLSEWIELFLQRSAAWACVHNRSLVASQTSVIWQPSISNIGIEVTGVWH